MSRWAFEVRVGGRWRSLGRRRVGDEREARWCLLAIFPQEARTTPPSVRVRKRGVSMAEGVVGRAWASYRERVIDPNAPVVQVTETRRAFYAGAQAVYMGIMSGLTAGPDAQPEDEELLESIEVELKVFVADVGAGRA